MQSSSKISEHLKTQKIKSDDEDVKMINEIDTLESSSDTHKRKHQQTSIETDISINASKPFKKNKKDDISHPQDSTVLTANEPVETDISIDSKTSQEGIKSQLSFYDVTQKLFEFVKKEQAADKQIILTNSAKLQECINKVLEKAKIYRTVQHFDRRTLLELYGFALSLSDSINDKDKRLAIQDDILRTFKEFAYEVLGLKKGIELANLGKSFSYFKNTIKNMRSCFNLKKMKITLTTELEGSFTLIIEEMFRYLHQLLGGPPLNHRYTMVSIGALATRMLTPYSDIEYFVLVEPYSEEIDVYFKNFADFFELMVIGFGESPLYKAEAQLKELMEAKEYKSSFAYFKRGVGVDEHERPQDDKRFIRLINTSEEILKKLPTIMYEHGSHLTAALLTTEYLSGDKVLYDSYQKRFQEFLSTEEYLLALRKLLEQGRMECHDALTTLNMTFGSFQKKGITGEIEIKSLLLHGIHMAQELAIFLKSCGVQLSLKNNFFDTLNELKKQEYITLPEYLRWNEFVKALLILNIQCQELTESANAILPIKVFDEATVGLLCELLKEITSIVDRILKDKEKHKNTLTIQNVTVNKTNPSYPTFGIPKTHCIFVGRKDLLDSLHKNLHPDQKDVKESQEEVLMVTTLSAGMGGIGKTQLALYYIHNAKHPYTARIWLPAENKAVLEQKYLELARLWGFIDEKASTDDILRYVKDYLQKRPGWLLVYDNAHSYEKLKDFLPKKGGRIIITTRQQRWPQIFKPLNILVMTEADALLLIKSIIQKEEKETELKDLAKALGYLPLALTQASTYIRETGTNIAEYLKRYQQYAAKLLSEGLPEGEKGLPVATTWNLSFETIAKEALDNKKHPLALELLIVSAYLNPDNIPRTLLLTWLKKASPQLKAPELVLDKCLDQLQRYSLINFGENSIGVHRLVQTIIRYKHQEAKKLRAQFEIPYFTVAWFNELIAAVNNEFNCKTKVLEDEARERGLLPHLQCLVDYAKLYLQEPNKEVGNLLHNIGFVFSRQGAAKLAAEYFNQALKIQEMHLGKEHPEVAIALINLGNAYGTLGDIKQQKEMLERALKIKETHYGKEHPEVAITIANLGVTYGDLGDNKQSKELLERALKIQEVHLGKEHPEVAITLTSLGFAYGTLGDSKQSKELLERALKIQEMHLGKEHPEVAIALINLGNAYGALGDSKQQKELLERALKILEVHYSKEHPSVATTLANLGITYGALGDSKQSKELLERALKIKEAHYGNEHPKVAITLTNLGIAYGALGDSKQQKELLERALKILEVHYSKEHPSVATTLANLGNAYGALGDSKQGKELLERALKIKEAHYGNDHPKVAITLYNLAIANRRLEQYEIAYPLAERSYQIYLKLYGEQHKNTKDADNLRKQYYALASNSASQQPQKLIFSAGTAKTNIMDVDVEKLNAPPHSNKKN